MREEELVQKFLESYEDDKAAYVKAAKKYDRQYDYTFGRAHSSFIYPKEKQIVTVAGVNFLYDIEKHTGKDLIDFRLEDWATKFGNLDNSNPDSWREDIEKVTADDFLVRMPYSSKWDIAKRNGTLSEFVNQFIAEIPAAVEEINNYRDELVKNHADYYNKVDKISKAADNRWSKIKPLQNKTIKSWKRENPFGEGSKVRIDGKTWTVKSINADDETAKMISPNGAVRTFDLNKVMQAYNDMSVPIGPDGEGILNY